MRVTAKGEYAAQAVLHLSLRYPSVVAIHEIAERHHIPIKYLEQILLELKRGGILESRRGIRGGYTLAEETTEVDAWYRGIDLYVAPSRTEGFGLTPLEAMASGVAVIAGDVGAYPEIIVSGETGAVVPTGDLAAYIAAIEPYLADPALVRP